MDVQTLLPLAVQASLVLVVVVVGLQARFEDLFYVLKRPTLLVRGLLSVNVIFPIVAILVLLMLPIHPIVKLGLALMSISPMAPFLPGKLLKAGVDHAYVVGLYAALMLFAVFVVPLTASILSALFPGDISLPVMPIATLVFQSVLLPLVAGLAIASLWPAFAARAAPIVNGIAYAILGVVVLLVLWKQGMHILGLLGDGTLAAIAAMIAIGLAAGHFLGGPKPTYRIALAQATVTRHPGIAMLIAKMHFDEPRIMLAVLLYLLSSVIFTGLYMKWIHSRRPAA